MRAIALYALYWFAAGAIFGLGLQAVGAIAGANVFIMCGGLNVLMGLIGLAIVTAIDEQARKAFYDDPRAEERGGWLLFLLIALPFPLLVLGLIWWLLSRLGLL